MKLNLHTKMMSYIQFYNFIQGNNEKTRVLSLALTKEEVKVMEGDYIKVTDNLKWEEL